MKVIIQFKRKPVIFQNPEFIIQCNNPLSFEVCFRDMESALKKGYHLAGFLSYEAGYCFEERLREDKNYDFPLIYLGAYAKPASFKTNRKKILCNHKVNCLGLNISRERYFSDIQTIRRHIAKGNVYQITYCIKLLF
jgi:para-aminobenzoate synthetase / 4-amino-4-deoxychorismate lyase